MSESSNENLFLISKIGSKPFTYEVLVIVKVFILSFLKQIVLYLINVINVVEVLQHYTIDSWYSNFLQNVFQPLSFPFMFELRLKHVSESTKS